MSPVGKMSWKEYADRFKRTHTDSEYINFLNNLRHEDMTTADSLERFASDLKKQYGEDCRQASGYEVTASAKRQEAEEIAEELVKVMQNTANGLERRINNLKDHFKTGQKQDGRQKLNPHAKAILDKIINE